MLRGFLLPSRRREDLLRTFQESSYYKRKSAYTKAAPGRAALCSAEISLLLGQLAGAMGAAGSLDGDLTAAEGAFLGGGSSGGGRSGGLFSSLLGLVDRFDEEEDAQSDEEEINDGLDESAVIQGGAAGFHSLLDGGEAFSSDTVGVLDDGEHAGNAAGTGDQADERHDHISDQRGNDLAEGTADDNADGHIQHVALHSKLFEFLNELFHRTYTPSIIGALALFTGTVYHVFCRVTSRKSDIRHVFPPERNKKLKSVIFTFFRVCFSLPALVKEGGICYTV